MKHLYALTAALLFCTTLMAVPAQRIKKTVALADGTQVTVTVCGDEYATHYIASDGRHLLSQADGTFVYATPQEVQAMRQQAPRRVGSRATAPLRSIGEVNVPVVLVQFADRSFIETDPAKLVSDYDLFFNGENYTGHGSVSSVRDYFLHESDGLFQPHFTVLGPVTLDQGYAYYGKNEGKNKDVNYSEFCKETLQKLTSTVEGVDWQTFDNGGNGDVDMVFFIFAGTGENATGNTDELWPKESTGSTTVNGIKFETSALCNEARLSQQTYKLDGIGVILHELMHALGLPDFYDTTNGATPVYGMDLFSIMDYGEYNSNGYKPSGLTAYERDFLGWRSLETITEAGTYTLQPSNATGAVGYKVVNDLNPNEYYVLEYRAAVGNDQNLAKYTQGMTVTHVDFNSSLWNGNIVNVDPSHQRLTLLPAAGEIFGIGWITTAGETQKYFSNMAYLPFPGEGKVDSLTNDNPVYPAATYTGRFMSKPIYNIKEDREAQTVTFNFLKPASEEDGVASVPGASAQTVWYTLDGRRLTGKPQQGGIYICNDKKIIIKQ